MRLPGKVALITGAAHGMGEAEANMFAKEGAKVVVADVLRQAGQQVIAGIAELGSEALFTWRAATNFISSAIRITSSNWVTSPWMTVTRSSRPANDAAPGLISM
jgi:NAD(P)-dependent dehydrogenase (short-subunit alcohol dehydrogenase family)